MTMVLNQFWPIAVSWRFETSTDEGALRLRQQMLVGTCLNPFMIWKCRPTALQLFSHHSKYIIYYKRLWAKILEIPNRKCKGYCNIFLCKCYTVRKREVSNSQIGFDVKKEKYHPKVYHFLRSWFWVPWPNRRRSKNNLSALKKYFEKSY